MSTVTESWLWFQLLLAHLAEFAEAALVFNVTYIRKAGSSSLPVTVDVSTSTLTHIRPPVMSSLHSPVTTPQPPLCVSDLFSITSFHLLVKKWTRFGAAGFPLASLDWRGGGAGEGLWSFRKKNTLMMTNSKKAG